MAEPARADLARAAQYRIIPSRLPTIALFENLVDADELEVLYALESLTNDRIQAEAGDLYLLDKEDWVTGPGASVVMAAFTHTGRESRFSDGTYGVYYAALTEAAAIAETVFHSERRLRETAEEPIELELRCYRGTVLRPLDDLRSRGYARYCRPELTSWPAAQHFASKRRSAGAWGLVYPSARSENGECVAAFKPRAVSKPKQTKHFRYCWNGDRIDRVLAITEVPLG